MLEIARGSQDVAGAVNNLLNHIVSDTVDPNELAKPSDWREYDYLDTNSIYVSSAERFVVSLIVGYGDEDLETIGQDGDDPMMKAAAAALGLTTDEGSSGTMWHVHDSKTGIGRFFEQGDFYKLKDRTKPHRQG